MERGKDRIHEGMLNLAEGQMIGPGYPLDDLEYSVTLRSAKSTARTFRLRFEPDSAVALAVPTDE